MAYQYWNNTYGFFAPSAGDSRTELIYPLLRSQLNTLPHQTILDIGGGNGATLHNLVDLDFEQATVIDINASLLEFGHHNINDPRISFVQADVMQPLPLRDESQDAVLAIHLLNDVADVQTTAAHIARALKPNGTCHIVIIHPFVPLYWQIADKSKAADQHKIPGFQRLDQTEPAAYRLSRSGECVPFYPRSFEGIANAFTANGLALNTACSMGAEPNTIEHMGADIHIPKFAYLQLVKKAATL
jgi:SAM-dependent methyltransferase